MAEQVDVAGFVFGLLFLMFISAGYLLYAPRAFGFITTKLLGKFFLSVDEVLTIGSLTFAPLRMRIFFKGVHYFSANTSLKITDGILTFSFWGTLLGNDNWVELNSLLKRASEGKKGSMKEKKGESSTEEKFRDDAAHLQTFDFPTFKSPTEKPEDTEMKNAFSTSEPSSPGSPRREGVQPKTQKQRLIASYLGRRCKIEISGVRWNAIILGVDFLGETITVRFVDSLGAAQAQQDLYEVPLRDVLVPERRGRLGLHLNGMSLNLHNNSARYEKLKKQSEGSVSPADSTEEKKEAVDVQQSNSLMTKIMGFMKQIEFEAYSSTIDIGGVGQKHPYFLHLAFEKMQGAYSVTLNGVSLSDLFRHLVDVKLTEVTLRWANFNEGLNKDQVGAQGDAQKKDSEGSKAKKSSNRLRTFGQGLAKGAALMMSGEGDTAASAGDKTSMAENIKLFGDLIRGQSHASMRILYYWDQAGLHKGEHITTETLPRTGLEIDIDTDELHYGPWCDYCRKNLMKQFLPPDFQPWPLFYPMQNTKRPPGMMEQMIEFTRDTRIIIPFKHKKVCPSPPFGIEDSGRVGALEIEMGAGSRYIYKVPWVIYPDERKLMCETLIRFIDVKIKTSYNDSYFIKAKEMEVFLDALYPLYWNDHQSWDIILKFVDAEIFYYSDWVNYFWDLLADFSYTGQMSHGEPIESFNSVKWYTTEFIPYVQQYEVFFEASTSSSPAVRMYWNVNPHNILLHGDAASTSHNQFVIIQAQQGYIKYFCPLDGYCLLFENEFKYTNEFLLTDMSMSLSLPSSHPLSDCKGNEKFFTCKKLRCHGYFDSMYMTLARQVSPEEVPNGKSSGMTEKANSSTMNIDMVSVKANLMGHHLKALAVLYDNYFTENCSTITADEFFWLKGTLRGAEDGRNVGYPFMVFQTLLEPRRNDLEFYMNVHMTQVDIALSAGETFKETDMLLTTSDIKMSLNSMAILFDVCMNINPVVARFPSSTDAKDAFIAIGGIQIGKSSFYGPAPDYVLFHSNSSVNVGKISFNLSIDHVANIFHLLEMMQEHMAIEDPSFNEQLNYSMNNFDAEPTFSVNDQQPPLRRRARRSSIVSISSFAVSSHHDEERKEYEKSAALQASRAKFRLHKNVDSDTKTAFVAYMEHQLALREFAADYGIFSSQINVRCLQLNMKMKNAGSLSIEAAAGVTCSSTTLNDTNSNYRRSIIVPSLLAQLFTVKTPDLFVAEVAGDFLEVAYLKTAVAFREYVAFPFEEGLQSHFNGQRDLVKTFDHMKLVHIDFEGILRHSKRQGTVELQSPRFSASEKKRSLDPAEPDLKSCEETRDSFVSDWSGTGYGVQFQSCRSKPNSQDETDSQRDLSDEEDSSPNIPIPAFRVAEPLPPSKPTLDYHRCLRPFELQVDGGPSTILAYSTASKFSVGQKRPQHHTNFIHHCARTPSVAYVLTQRTQCTAGNMFGAIPSAEQNSSENITWAMRSAKNNRRSRDGTTTHQYHIESIKDIEFFITPNGLRLGFELEDAFNVRTSTLSERKRSRSISRSFRNTVRWQPTSSKQTSKTRLKAKTRQWSFTENIVTVVVPRITVHVLQQLPVSAQNIAAMTHQSPTRMKQVNGVYQTYVSATGSQVVYVTSQPPSLAAARQASTKKSISVQIQSLSAGTETVWEPIPRDKKYIVNLMGLNLSPQNDFVGGFTVSGLSLRGKYESSGESHGSVSRMQVSRVEVYATTNIVNFLSLSERSISQIISMRGISSKKRRSTHQMNAEFSFGSPADLNQTQSEIFEDSDKLDEFASQADYGNVFLTILQNEEVAQQVEGSVVCGAFFVELVDVQRSPGGQVMLIDLKKKSMIRISETSLSYTSATTLGVEREEQDIPTTNITSVVDCAGLVCNLFPTVLRFFNESGEVPFPANSLQAPDHDSKKIVSVQSITQIVVHHLDVSFLHSPTSLIQVKAAELCGGLHNPLVPVEVPISSFADQDATQGISQFVRSKLSAHAARIRRRTRAFASAPEVNHQQALTESATFFASNVIVQFVADVTLLKHVVELNLLPTDLSGEHRQAVVLSAIMAQIEGTCQEAFDMKLSSVIHENIQLHSKGFLIDAPFRPNAIDIIHPQYSALLDEWTDAWDAFRRKNVASSVGGPISPQTPAPLPTFMPAPQPKVYILSVNVVDSRIVVGLPNDISVSLIFPELIVWATKAEKTNRSSLRCHLKSSSILSKSGQAERGLPLPQIFVLANVEENKVAATIMVDCLEAVVSVDLFNHALLMYEKITTEIIAMLTPQSGEEGDVKSQEKLPTEEEKLYKVAIVLAGCNVSLISELCEFRFTLGGFNSCFEKIHPGAKVVWIAHLNRFQIGLYDKDDYNQRTLHHATTGGAESSTSAANRKTTLTGYAWGLLSFEVSLSNDAYHSSLQTSPDRQDSMMDQSLDLKKEDSLRDSFSVASENTNGGGNSNKLIGAFSHPTIVLRAGCAEHAEMMMDEFMSTVERSRREIRRNTERIRARLERSRQYRRLLLTTHQLKESVSTNGTLLPTTTVMRFTVSQFILVVPSGDSVYADLSLGGAQHVSCQKADNHVHSISCLDRKRFVPFFALKVSIQWIEITSLQEPMMNLQPESPTSASSASSSNIYEQLLEIPLKQTVKVHCDQIKCFTTDGTRIDARSSHISHFLPAGRLVGGLGLLAEWEEAEFDRTKNKMSIDAFEIQLQKTSSDTLSSIAGTCVILSPEFHLSSRGPVLLDQMLQDFSRHGVLVSPLKRRPSVATLEEKTYPNKVLNSCVDFSIKLGSGTISLHSFQPQINVQAASQKRVTFSLRQQRKQLEANVGTDRVVRAQSTQLFQIPSPSVIALCNYVKEHEQVPELVCRFNIQSPPIEIPPTMSVLLREITHWREVTAHDQVERGNNVIGVIKFLEEQAQATHSLPPLHTTYLDALLPMPRSFALRQFELLAQKRLRRMHRRQTSSVDYDLALPSSKTGTRTVILVNISACRFSLVCTPVSSTALTCFLDDQGAIDFVYSCGQVGPAVSLDKTASSLHATTTTTRPPPIPHGAKCCMSLSVSKLHLECHTKLESKSLECSLPEAQISYALGDDERTLVVNIPARDVRKEAPEIVLRLANSAQLYLVFKLWNSNAEEAQRQLELSQRLALANQGEQKPRLVLPSEQNLLPLVVLISVSKLSARLDVGAGNKHDLLLSGAQVSLTRDPVPAKFGGNDYILMNACISSFVWKSEGVVSGDFCMPKNFFLRYYKTGKKVKGGRTKAIALEIPQIRCNYKERQMKEIFVLQTDALKCFFADQIGSGLTCNIKVSKYSLGITPDTVPVFTLMKQLIAECMKEQQAEADAKIQNSPFSVFSPPQPSTPETPATEELQEGQNSADPSSLQDEAKQKASRPAKEKKGKNLIPYCANEMSEVPIGEVKINLQEGEVMIGAIVSNFRATEAQNGVVLTLPSTSIWYAEFAQGNKIKRALVLEINSWLLVRPSTKRVTILGCNGQNVFELVSAQDIGASVVKYKFSFDHSEPWSGSPHVADFEALNATIASFTGGLSATSQEHPSPSQNRVKPSSSKETKGPPEPTTDKWGRQFVALGDDRFAPELRVVGDMSVSIDTILGWLNVSQDIPIFLYHNFCDPCEVILIQQAKWMGEKLETHQVENTGIEATPVSATSKEDDGTDVQ